MALQEDDEDDDDEDEEAEEDEEEYADFETDGGGVAESLFGGLGGERKTLIFSGDAAARSYSSMRLARSSSEVMDTKASRSSAGNWQRRCLTAEPHSSSSFSMSSVHTHAITVITTNLTLRFIAQNGTLMSE